MYPPIYRNVSRLIGSLLLMLLIAPGLINSALAQSGATAASITGSVKDETGAVIPGAAITIRNEQTNLSRETHAGEDGAFLILQLPPGDYKIDVSAAGFHNTVCHLNLPLGTTSLFNFTLHIATADEIVEVNAYSAIDFGKTESSTNIDRSRIDNLPINKRDFLDFSLTAARVLPDRQPQQGITATSGLSFNGQTARSNNITIDGLDNNDPVSASVRSTFSQEAVQEFQVLTDNYSAEFGRALSGIVNIVTRGGGNDYHGNLFLFNRNDEISARDIFAPFKPPYSQYQFGAVLGGPIRKDKLFFFTSFERLSIKQNNFVTISDQSVAAARDQNFLIGNGPEPFAIGNSAALARVDARLSENDTLWLRYNYGGSYNGAFESFGGLVDQTNGGIQRLTDNSIAVDNSYLSSRLNLINETRFLYNRRDQDVDPTDPNGTRVQIVAPEGLITFGRSGFLPQPRQERIYQFIDNVTLTRGNHEIRFGLDYEYYKQPFGKTAVPFFPGGFAFFGSIDFAAFAGVPGLPFFSGLESFDPKLRSAPQRAFLMLLTNLAPSLFKGFPSNVPFADLPLPLIYLQGFGDPRAEVSKQQIAAFFQDNFKLRKNLLVKLGLRFDRNNVDFAPTNSGNFAPRVALSYRPERLPNLNLHAAYGLFFGVPFTGTAVVIDLLHNGKLKLPVSPFPFGVLPFGLPQHHFPNTTEIPPNVQFIPQLSQDLSFAKDLRNSYTQQANFGIDYFIGNNSVVSANYNYVRGVKLFGPRSINPVVRPIPGDPVTSAITGRADPTQGDLAEFESAFDSYYHALTISFNRRFSNRVGLLSSYTFSKSIDNLLDIRSDLVESNNPLLPGQERGLSANDVRHRFQLSGTWELSYTQKLLLRDFQLSTIIDIESGEPFNLLAGVDLNMNGDNPPGDRPTGLGRNVGIKPGFANVDLRLTRTIAFKERVRVQGFAEVFNLFNKTNISEINRIYPPNLDGSFNLPPISGGRYQVTADRYRGAFAPRQFQFGFKLAF